MFIVYSLLIISTLLRCPMRSHRPRNYLCISSLRRVTIQHTCYQCNSLIINNLHRHTHTSTRQYKRTKHKIRNLKSDIRNPKSAIRNHKSAIRHPTSDIRNHKSAIRNPQSFLFISQDFLSIYTYTQALQEKL